MLAFSQLEKRFILMAMTADEVLTGSGSVSLAQPGASNPFAFHLAPPLGHAPRPYLVTMNVVIEARTVSIPDLDLVVLASKTTPTSQEQADSMRAIVQSAELPVDSSDGISVLAVRPLGSDTNVQLDGLTLPAGSAFILVYLRTVVNNSPVTVKRIALVPAIVGDEEGKEGTKRTWTRAMDEALLAALYPVMMGTVKSFTDCAAGTS